MVEGLCVGCAVRWDWRGGGVGKAFYLAVVFVVVLCSEYNAGLALLFGAGTMDGWLSNGPFVARDGSF